jgi:hypothetical protein
VHALTPLVKLPEKFKRIAFSVEFSGKFSKKSRRGKIRLALTPDFIQSVTHDVSLFEPAKAAAHAGVDFSIDFLTVKLPEYSDKAESPGRKISARMRQRPMNWLMPSAHPFKLTQKINPGRMPELSASRRFIER